MRIPINIDIEYTAKAVVGIASPVLGVVTLYVLALSGLEISEGFGFRPDWFDLLGAAALAFMCGLGAIAFLRADHHHALAVTQQSLDQVRANVAGSAGHQDVANRHVRLRAAPAHRPTGGVRSRRR